MAEFDTVEIETGTDPAGSVIWLHGLGADGHDFEPIVPELNIPPELPLRFVFPHAPVRPVTVNGGIAMRAWFDILSFDTNGRADEEGLRASSAMLEALVAREQGRGISTERIVLAGFSQGGAVAIHTALRSRDKFAGLMALSTFLALPGTLKPEVIDVPEAGDPKLPIFMAHGTFDPVLPLQLGRDSAAAIEGAGFTIEWNEYPMAHGVCPAEINDIRAWLLRVYPA